MGFTQKEAFKDNKTSVPCEYSHRYVFLQSDVRLFGKYCKPIYFCDSLEPRCEKTSLWGF